ncbi:MAG: hypothetical protein Q9169_001440 [Polycauliona sp. 2 TL-2023]
MVQAPKLLVDNPLRKRSPQILRVRSALEMKSKIATQMQQAITSIVLKREEISPEPFHGSKNNIGDKIFFQIEVQVCSAISTPFKAARGSDGDISILPIHQSKSGIMEAIKQTVAQNFGGAAHQAVSESQQFALEQVPSLTGKVAVITGGSEGIGYGCSHTMLTNDIKKLFILSVSKEVVDGAVNAVKEEMGQEAADKMVWLQCDLSDWKQVKETADKIASSTDRIDIMINNAARGIMTYQTTDYGVDRHMALNHMGHVILNSHLMPIMKKTASDGNTVRIVILSSNAHQGTPSDCKFESLDELNQDLGPNGQYGRSKLAGILYARYLARHLTQSHPNILANATHPGFVDTKMSTQDIHEPYPLGGYAMSVGMAPIKKDIWMGAVSTMFAATKTSKSGEYLCPPAVPESGTDLAQNEELGERLMKLTRDLVKEKTYADSAAKGCPFADY